MNIKRCITMLAVLLTFVLITPTAFLVAPQRASASGVSCIGGIVGGAAGYLLSAANVPTADSLTQTETGATAGATIGSCINDTILIPLARAAIRSILQQITASTINWINGGNGTGHPSFVPNLSVHLQGVGDSVALSFIGQIATRFNSPFGSAISSSLRINYLQQTSRAGFYAANQSTLAASSPNINAFLSGNWSQGGIGTWFALTTQPRNNPYMLYQAAQSQLARDVGEAQANRRQDLSQSGGFLSWCGGDSTASPTSTTIDESTASAAQQQCIDNGGTADQCQTVYDTYLAQVGTSVGVSPQAPCTTADGRPAQALTPGSIIHDYTQQAVVNSGFQQLVSATDLDNALGAIVTALTSQVLGGVGGLLGASKTSSSQPTSFTTQLQNYSSSNTSASGSAISTIQATLSRVTSYTNAWQTIAAAANTASTSVMSLASFCTAAASTAQSDPLLAPFVAAATAQATAATTALATEVAPVLAQAQAAPSTVADTTTFANKVEAEALSAASATSATSGSASTLSADISTLLAMPPSAAAVVNVQQNAQALGGARANPAGSLTVTGSSLVDRMNLISTNAEALKVSACTPSTFTTGSPESSAI